MDSAPATPREEAIRRFLTRHGWDDAARAPLAGDASARRYERLRRGDEKAVLMDAPPGSGEEIRPFVRIADHLLGLGLSAPRILAEDEALGFLLLEDLGDGLFARLVEGAPEMEVPFYEAAAEVLVALGAAPCPDGLPKLDASTAPPLIAPLFDWYHREAGPAAQATVIAALAEAIDRHGGPGEVFVHRDYHAENLLWLPDRKGVAQVGLLDFQLAHEGAAAYDLVSLLEDARRDVGEDARTAAMRLFADRTGTGMAALEAAMAVWGAQRNLRILGIFARLSLHLGKPQYIDLIPRVWGHLRRDLAHPALAEVARVAIPEPTEAVLERLKALCGTVPNP